MNQLFTGVVPVGPDGNPAPDLASPPVEVHTGDLCMTRSSESTACTQWIRTGDVWVQLEETLGTESEVDTLKRERVNSVRDYFRQKEDQYKRRKRYEAATELVSLFEQHKADLSSVVQKLWEDMK